MLALWFVALPILLIEIGKPEVTRTQEARVLETAREMLGQPWIDWLIPKLCGAVRLQKPPLTYWLTAAAFKWGGINEAIGRAPTAILGWLCLAATYCAARWLFDRRTAFFSAATLMGTFFFARFTRSAETDTPAMLGVTLAIYALWRGSQSSKWIPWMHLAAGAIALAIVSKGGPGGFPFIFLILFCAAERTVQPVLRFLKSGALITLIVLAAPWFVYGGHEQGWHTFIHELRTVEAGVDHSAPAYNYAPDFLEGTLPWSPIVVIAIIAAATQWRDSKLRGLLVWFISIALPLCLIGNKQNHYLMPLMPVTMILTGWLIDRAIESPAGAGQLVRIVLRIMVGAIAACAICAACVTRYQYGWFSPRDLIVGITLLAAVAWIIAFWLDQGFTAGIVTLALFTAMLMPPLVTAWIPTLSPEGPRAVARFIRQIYDPEHLCFFGSNASIPLCWDLKQSIPLIDNEPAIEQLAQHNPLLTVIAINKDGRPTNLPNPQRFEQMKSMQNQDQTWQFFLPVVRFPAAGPATTASQPKG